MLEAQNLDKLEQLNPVDVLNLLQLRSELKELKGSIKRSIKYFELQPLSVTRNNFGQRLENEAVYREDTENMHVRIAHWTFETQSLPVTSKDLVEIKVVRGISVEENISGAVRKAEQLVETQPWHTEDSEELSPAERSSQKSNKQDQGPTQDAAAPVTPQQSALSDS